MALTKANERVSDAARRLGLEIDISEFPEGTRTADEAARAIGVQVGQIVKSLVFMADGTPVVCLVSGANRLDTTSLAGVSGASEVRRASADEAREGTGYAVGGVPPFGHAQELAVYCDEDLMQYDVVWAAAGTPTAVFSAAPGQLVAACGAMVVRLKGGE